jgi:hypothetical protein
LVFSKISWDAASSASQQAQLRSAALALLNVSISELSQVAFPQNWTQSRLQQLQNMQTRLLKDPAATVPKWYHGFYADGTLNASFAKGYLLADVNGNRRNLISDA